MSEQVAAAPAPSEAAPPPIAGNSLLTQGYAPAPAAAPVDPKDGIAQAAIAAERPEWVPEKFWDAEKKAPRVEDMAKGYINLEKLVGSSEKIILPQAEDDKDGWERVYKAMGRPEAPEAYEFKRPEALPEGLNYDEDLEKNWRNVAHQNGLNSKQAKSIYETYVKHQVERQAAWVTQQGQTKAQAEMNLRRELGQQYEGSLQSARMALQTYADPDYVQYLEQTGQGNDPRVLRAWIKVGKELGGDRQLKGKPAEPNTGDAKRQIQEFDGKYRDVLFNRDHPDHKHRVAERNKLFEAAYGAE